MVGGDERVVGGDERGMGGDERLFKINYTIPGRTAYTDRCVGTLHHHKKTALVYERLIVCARAIACDWPCRKYEYHIGVPVNVRLRGVGMYVLALGVESWRE